MALSALGGVHLTSDLEARMSYLEQIMIIFILGGRFPRLPGFPGIPGSGPGVDPAAADTTRIQALAQDLLFRPKGDPFTLDLVRMMSVTDVENSMLVVNAELTRLRSVDGELNARLKELRSASAGPASGA